MPKKALHSLFLVALLLAATAISYGPAFKAGFVWDDDSYLTRNEVLDSEQALTDIWFSPTANAQYYPLVFTSLYIQKKIWGLNPIAYHAANIALHALAALLLWRVLALLGLPGAWAAALIFALHPINVESVAWVTERKNVLSGVFFMASALCLLRWFALPEDAGPGKRGGWYAGALAAFICALWSKTVTACLPAVFLALLWAKKGRVRRSDLAGLAPFFAAGLFLSMLTVWIERSHVGALGADWNLGAADRIIIAGRALWFYLGKILWPGNLSFVYERWTPNPASLGDLFYPASFLALAALLFILRKRIGRAPFAGLCVYFFCLFPSLGFFNVFPHRYSFVADHFAYLAMIAPVALISAAVARLPARLPARASRLPAALLVLCALALAGLTHSQCKNYQDLETLWTRTLEANPKAWMAHNNLGVLLSGQGRLNEARYHFLQSMALRSDLAEVWYNLAGIFDKRGDKEKARRYLVRAGELEKLPARVAYLVGNALEEEGRRDEALAYYQKALEKDPEHPAAHYAIGAIYDSRGREKQALYHYVRALLQDARLGEAYYGIGLILSRHGQWERAAAYFRTAAKTRSDKPDVFHNLGVCLAQMGSFGEAETLFEKTLAMDPAHLQARENLAILLARRGNEDRAIEEFSSVVALDPGNAEAWYNLGALRAGQGELARAGECFARAVSENPDLAAARFGLGTLLEETGEEERALPHLREAARLEPENIRYRERLEAAEKAPGAPESEP